MNKNIILDTTLHPSTIAKSLIELRQKDTNSFLSAFDKIPANVLGEILLDLPEYCIDNILLEYLSDNKLKESIKYLATDDATDLIQEIEKVDIQKANTLLNSIGKKDKENIKWLKRYNDDQAGAFMQTELLKVTINETIQIARERLRDLKNKNELDNVHQVFIVDKSDSLIDSILLEELFIEDFNKTFEDILKNKKQIYTMPKIMADDNIKNVIKVFEDYDLSVVPIVGYKDRLIGRITSDDVYDMIEESATEQIYNLAGVKENRDYEGSIKKSIKNRAFWLFLNLITAILASVVIGAFEETLSSYVALAILMPIVASMGGNAGTQTLTIVVRQLALGDIVFANAKEVVKKEIIIAVINGFIFAVITGFVAYIWFDKPLLGVVIAISLLINIFLSGFFGSLIPLGLKKLNIDPAVGSTVLLTTATDVAGFFSFLILAKYILL
jgi:magnesium transporter